MRFKELLSKYEWDDIEPVLVKLHLDQEKNLAGYRQVFETLRAIQPGETKMRLVISRTYWTTSRPLLLPRSEDRGLRSGKT